MARGKGEKNKYGSVEVNNCSIDLLMLIQRESDVGDFQVNFEEIDKQDARRRYGFV